MKRLLTIIWVTLVMQGAHSQGAIPGNDLNANEGLTVNVHPGVELMAIVQILAGKYSEPTPSVYSAAMKEHFSPFANHPAVVWIKGFKKNVYPDFIELGWCFDRFPDLQLTEPLTTSWYRHYGKDTVLKYLKLVKDFYTDSKFWSFYTSHEPQYARWAKDLHQKIADSASLAKLYGFYRMGKPLKLYIGIEPLNSWGAHAITNLKDINPHYQDHVAYETGYFNDTATIYGQPRFTAGTETIYDLLWHEGSHIMIAGLMKKYSKEIQGLSYLFNAGDEGMRRNNISSWEYCLNENIVRSVVACLKRQYRGYRQYEKTISREDAADFIYVNELAPMIWDLYLTGNKYPDFNAFFPVLLERLQRLVPKGNSRQ